jgi:hypothetical protein
LLSFTYLMHHHCGRCSCTRSWRTRCRRCSTKAGAHNRSYSGRRQATVPDEARTAADTWLSEHDVPDAAHAFLDQLDYDLLVRNVDRAAAMRAFHCSLAYGAAAGVRRPRCSHRLPTRAETALKHLRLTADWRRENIERRRAWQ